MIKLWIKCLAAGDFLWISLGAKSIPIFVTTYPQVFRRLYPQPERGGRGSAPTGVKRLLSQQADNPRPYEKTGRLFWPGSFDDPRRIMRD